MDNNKKIIAVVGMCGAGKTEVVNYLKKKLECPNVYFGEATFDRLKKEGMEVNYENERTIRERIRDELGPGAYATLALPKIDTALQASDVCLIESMYSWAEYKIVKEKFGDNFACIAVWASPQTRLKRLMARSNERPIKDEAEFIERDFSEIEGTDKGGPIARADFLVINEGEIQGLREEIDRFIKNILN